MGLHFEILAVDPGEIYERRGRVQRIVGIRGELFHHPDALLVPEVVFSRFSDAFRAAHPKFNFYGPTEYQFEDIVGLRNELNATCRAASQTISHGERDTEDSIQIILGISTQAIANGQSLLVLGI